MSFNKDPSLVGLLLVDKRAFQRDSSKPPSWHVRGFTKIGTAHALQQARMLLLSGSGSNIFSFKIKIV